MISISLKALHLRIMLVEEHIESQRAYCRGVSTGGGGGGGGAAGTHPIPGLQKRKACPPTRIARRLQRKFKRNLELKRIL